VLPFSHVYGMTGAMNVPVAMGATMVIMPGFVTRNVLEAIKRHKPTIFPGVPTMFVAINNFPGARRYGIRSIRACISGAAPLPVEVQEAFEKLTRGRLVEGYGLTEATTVTHANPLYGRRKVGSIGIPVPSTEAKILDLASGREVPAGQIGELAVRGPQVMQGYWNDPKPREFITRDGWLLTGDVARMDADGYCEVVARKREMILAGDYQVFPRDVEEVLYEHPKVREVAVVGVQPARWPFQRVKAYVVLRAGQDASEDELIALCKRRLEEYAVPWQIEFRKELPKNFVGKVVRRLLVE
jgi:long-chain acyl-CoA synthetase